MPKAISTPTPAAAPTLHYEDAMTELEALVGRMENGGLPLDQLLAGYQRGAELLQVCRDRLQAVEEQIKVLDQGVIKPWKGA